MSVPNQTDSSAPLANRQTATASPVAPKLPLPQEDAHPLRFAINGVTDKIAELKDFVAAQDFDPDLKAFIASELDELSSNAATIHLHDVEYPEGGFDLHLSIHAVRLGERAGAVIKRNSKAGETPAPLPELTKPKE